MNSTLLSMAAVALVFSQAAQASNTGIIRFTGSVTDVTCNIIPVDEGGAATSDISLGTVEVDLLTDTSPGTTPANFSLIPAAGSPVTCFDGTKTVEVGFNGAYDNVGLGNVSGTAGNVSVSLEGSTGTAWHSYTSTSPNAELIPDTGTGAIRFRAAMIKTVSGVDATVGTVITQATYSVVYK